jgi:hypothetical protein
MTFRTLASRASGRLFRQSRRTAWSESGARRPSRSSALSVWVLIDLSVFFLNQKNCTCLSRTCTCLSCVQMSSGHETCHFSHYSDAGVARDSCDVFLIGNSLAACATSMMRPLDRLLHRARPCSQTGTKNAGLCKTEDDVYRQSVDNNACRRTCLMSSSRETKASRWVWNWSPQSSATILSPSPAERDVSTSSCVSCSLVVLNSL